MTGPMTIEEDIRAWSREVLERPNPHMPHNLPACPYAEKAWRDNLVHVVETSNPIDALPHWVSIFPTCDWDLIILAGFNYPGIAEFEAEIDALNAENGPRDIFLMGFHPDYGAEDQELDFLYEHEWESGVEQDYAMVFVQSFSQVIDASRKLDKLGYYEAFPQEEYEQLVVDRQRRFEQWR